MDNKLITIFTIVACTIIAYLIFGHQKYYEIDVSYLPVLNVCLNSITILLLFSAFISIKKQNQSLHKILMISAMFCSIIFLLSYLIYHFFSPGPKLYTGEWKLTYQIILFSHIILAVLILPLILKTFLFGIRDNKLKHKKIARYTFPLWCYVSFTGIVVYIMLYL